jgi:hypothetical protein
MTAGLSVVAIIAAYNEADIIGQVVGHLVEQGIGVYLMDHHSTDGTVAAVERFRGRGLIGIERFPEDGRASLGDERAFSLEGIVRRKAALAHELAARWCINHDADEFRESPWPGLDLRQAIEVVDLLGYNAIDFAVFNFWPTHDGFKAGDDVREAFPFCAPGEPWNRTQIRCWKRQVEPVDLASTGGHEAVFPGRQVCPVRFILRHYPIRSQAHGTRKVFRERLPRFSPAERARAWHVHYDGIQEGHRFIRDPATLERYDPVAVRRQLIAGHPGADALRRQLDDQTLTIHRLHQDLHQRDRRIEAVTAEAAALRARLDQVLASRSWRWTAPLRAVLGRLAEP